MVCFLRRYNDDGNLLGDYTAAKWNLHYQYTNNKKLGTYSDLKLPVLS